MPDNKPLVAFSQSFVRLETNGEAERLHVDYAIANIEQTRKEILLRSVLQLVAREEARLYNLSDHAALAELDLLRSLAGRLEAATKPVDKPS